MNARADFNVIERGATDGKALVFAHGFGCDQHMWRLVAPAFEDDHRIVLFDYVGMGGAQASYDRERYATLDGYAADVLRICEELDLREVVLVGHSVSAIIGTLAQIAAPDRFDSLVMVGPSPRYINDGDYVGGFEQEDIDGLLDSLASNYLGWSHAMAPAIMGNPDRPELGAELEASFCTVDPEIAEQFARATFLSDNRSDLARVTAPTLVLQSREDVIAPLVVGQYVADHIPDSTLVVLDSTGHCPHLSAPDQVTSALRAFLS
ncbi:MAG: alpha/beta hydrolase [Marmoricola sp.]|nr:alpha/beta hydrolase [Marmoricola sp.]